LVVAPYYNKPTQKGLIDHFTAIADSVSCGVMLYNIPGRSVVNMSIDTIVNLAKHRNILALKEATGSVSYLCEIFDAVKKNQTSLELLSGDDGNFLPSLSVGATGVVSVASNLIPKSMMALFEAAHSNDLDRARNIHQRLFPLFRDEFIESNPAPIKYALSKMGIGSPMVRLPLVPLSESHRPILDRLVKEMGDDHV